MSFGKLQFYGSIITPWLTLEQNSGDYTGSGANPQGRWEFVDWAVATAQNSGFTMSDFDVIIIDTYRQVDTWGGLRYVVCGPLNNITDENAMSIILQEVGHGLGLMNHSRSVANPIDYENPFCVMSSLTFGNTDPTFHSQFGRNGPGLCTPYIFKQGWLEESRIANRKSQEFPLTGIHPTLQF